MSGLVLFTAIFVREWFESDIFRGLHLKLGQGAGWIFFMGWLEYFGSMHFLIGHSARVGEAIEGFSFFAVMIYCICWSLFPPSEAEEIDMQNYVPLRKYMLRANYRARSNSFTSGSALPSAAVDVDEAGVNTAPGINGEQVFCLEMACFLLEASYQAYFASPSRAASSGYGGVGYSSGRVDVNKTSFAASTAGAQQLQLQPRPGPGLDLDMNNYSGPQLDLQRLGLTLKGTFTSREYSTFGFLSEAASDIVIAFRGSTLANLAADFKFHLMALPDLTRPKRFFVEIIERVSAMMTRVDQGHTVRKDDEEDDGGGGGRSASWAGAFLRMAVPAPTTTSTVKTPLNPTQSKDSPSSSISLSWLGLKKCADNIPLFNQNFSRVHVGFWEAYESVRDQYVTEVFLALRRRYTAARSAAYSTPTNDPVDGNGSNVTEEFLGHVYFTGHSLGAAMATLAALELSYNIDGIMEVLMAEAQYHSVDSESTASSSFPSRQAHHHHHLHHHHHPRPRPPALAMAVYGYGCPRLGNQVFSQLIESRVPACYRVQVDGDLVTMLPKFLGFYRHVGHAVLLDEHAAGSIVIKPSVLEMSFFKRTTGSIANHSLEKYRECLEACFEPEEYNEYLAREFMYLSGKAATDSTPTTHTKYNEQVPVWLVGARDTKV